jgi:uncharacterized repeat protein (TIGR02543 family)
VAAALLLATCNVLDAPPQGQEQQPQLNLPEGYGSFTLQMPSSVGRTILPGSLVWDDFTSFDIYFDRTDVPGTQDPTPNRTQTPPASGYKLLPELLIPGTYNVTVTAKNGTAAVARGVSKSPVIITVGNDTPATITLTAILNDTSLSGTFIWDVTFDPGAITVTTAQMTILQNDAPLSTPITETLASGSNGKNHTLAPGIYTVKFDFAGTKNSGTEPVVFTWYELLYVYANLESRFPATGTHTFNEARFARTHWNVTLNYNNDKLDDIDPDYYKDNNFKVSINTGTQSVLHGDTIKASLPGAGNVIPVPTYQGFRFDGWFENAAGTGTAWNIANGKVHNDMTLWAKWTPNTATITLSFDEILKGDAAHNAAANLTISRTGPTPPKTVTITVSPTTGITNYKWEVDGFGVYAKVITDNATASTFTLDGGNDNYNTFGGHTLRLTVTRGGNEYMVNIPFTVVE